MFRQSYGAIPRRNSSDESTIDPYLPGSENVKVFPDRWRKAPAWIAVIVIVLTFGYTLFYPPQGGSSSFEAAVWSSYDYSALSDIPPISHAEFVYRQHRLAKQVGKEEVDAFIAESGGTTQYYANFSGIDWELSERPFLLVVTPTEMFFLAPLFEVSRARMLSIPSNQTIKFITWAEDISPYKTLLEHLPSNPKIMVEDNVRSFISQNLVTNGAKVLPQSPTVSTIRETKSAAEITTVEAIRAIQKNIVFGMSEQTIRETLNNILFRAGLVPYFNIVLFGEDAANPHGGVDESRQLEQCEFILIDVGAVFHGYSSDITRTFLPKRTNIDDCDSFHGNRTLQDLWTIVYDAQSAAIASLNTNHTCADVDLAARRVIDDAGLGEYFTHRLGHGLGIEGHERPYLNRGNTHIHLQAGNVFTAEPGVYIEGVAGVRLEDVILVTDNKPEILSGDRAKDWFNP